MPETETIESLTEAMQGMMEVLHAHAMMLASVMRALDEEGIEVPGFRQPHRPVN